MAAFGENMVGSERSFHGEIHEEIREHGLSRDLLECASPESTPRSSSSSPLSPPFSSLPHPRVEYEKFIRLLRTVQARVARTFN